MIFHLGEVYYRSAARIWLVRRPKPVLIEGIYGATTNSKIVGRRTLAGERWQEYDLIFPSSVGTPLNTSNLRVDFLQTLEAAGLEKIRFHDLRHTAASLMLNHGVPVIVVSKILGHAKVSTTLDTYGHLINEMQDAAVKFMDEL